MFPIRDTIPSRTFPVVTIAFIIVNLLIFIFEVSLSERGLRQVFYGFGFIPARYTDPDLAGALAFPSGYLPFLTSMFLHGSWMHLISNMWMLWIFGDNVEDRVGHIGFTIFYIACGLSAAFVHLITNIGSSIPTVGASGAVAGVMGAYFLIYPHARIITLVPIFFYPLFIEVPAVVFLGIWFYGQFYSGVLSLAGSGQVGGIAWWAHIGGFITGGIISLLVIRRRHRY